MSFKKGFLFLALVPFCSVERDDFSNFGRESTQEHFCENILKSSHLPRRRCHLKVFSIFSSGGQLVQLSGTILAF